MPYITLILVVVLFYAGLWRIFKKAGKPGWASVVLVYNQIVFLEIVDRPIWWLFLFFLPFVNIVVSIIVRLDILAAFRKPQWHIFLILFFPFLYLPYLGFSDSDFIGRLRAPF